MAKMYGRLYSLLIPFIIWTCVILIYNRLYYHTDSIHSIGDVVRVFFFSPVAGPMWYVLALLIFMLPAPFIIFLKKKDKRWMLAVLIFLLAFSIVRLRINKEWPGNWWWYGNMIGFIPAYLFGVYLGLEHPQKILYEKYDKQKSKAVGVVFLISVLLMWIFGNWTFWREFSILECVGLWVLLDADLFKNRHSFMESAFFVYAMHQQIWIPLTAKHILSEIGTITSVRWLITFKVVQVFLVALFSFDIQIILRKLLPRRIYALFSGGR